MLCDCRGTKMLKQKPHLLSGSGGFLFPPGKVTAPRTLSGCGLHPRLEAVGRGRSMAEDQSTFLPSPGKGPGRLLCRGWPLQRVSPVTAGPGRALNLQITLQDCSGFDKGMGWSVVGAESSLGFLFVCLFVCLFFVFLESHQQHMEVPSIRVELDL